MDYLSSVQDDRVFLLGERRLKNLYDLLDSFKELSNETYSHYASSSHNYFADWIEHVIKYDELASRLRNSKNKDEATAILENALPKANPPPKAEEKIDQPVLQENKEKVEQEIISENKDEITPVKPEEIIVIQENTKKYSTEKDNALTHSETEALLKKISDNETQIKDFLWKHFAWDMAKEFMYGMAIGILIGLIVSKIFIKI